MNNPSAKLIPNLFDPKIEMVPTRDGYGKGVVEAGEKDERIVVLCADVFESTRSQWFQEKFPDRAIEVGVAEQNMVTLASGMASYGKIPFAASYAAFSPGRNWEQIRTTICLNNMPVKIVGAHAGISVGPDGATHQALEDIALMRSLPRMTVVVPCDAVEARKATLVLATMPGPGYIRVGREKSPVFTTVDSPFNIGRAEVLREVKDVAIIGCGILLHNCLVAAEELSKSGIEATVINNHTIKPMDEATIIAAAKKCGAVVTVEEHQVMGGMGSAVAEVLARHCPTPQEFVGMQDRFGESGKASELIEHFGLDSKGIIAAVHNVIGRK